jgi:hypothetical protein
MGSILGATFSHKVSTLDTNGESIQVERDYNNYNTDNTQGFTDFNFDNGLVTANK